MVSHFVLVPLNFLVASVLAFGINWVTAIPWRRAVAAHWTERARLLWPLRKAGVSNIVLIPTCLVLAEVAARQESVARGTLPWLAGLLGAVLGTIPLDLEAFPRFTLCSWLRLFCFLWTLRLGIGFGLIAGAVLMPGQSSAEMFLIATGVLLFIVAWNWGLFVRLLRAMRILRVPEQRLMEIVSGTAQRMGVREPRSWLLDVPLAQAFALPTTHELMFSTRLLEISPDDELSAICAHELAHLTESRGVLVARVAGAMSFYPLIFIRPALNFGSSAVGLIVGLTLVSVILTRTLSRRMEKRADKIAAENQAEDGIYARALERLYRDNLAPAVSPTNLQMHPHLYDRMLTAGIQPDYPRPAKPMKMAWSSLLLWIAYVVLMLLTVRS